MRTSLLPAHASDLLHAMDKALDALSLIPTAKVATLWNPWLCPKDWLPWLAFAMRATEWDDHWTEQQKRQYIASLPYVNRIRGTKKAVSDALASIDKTVTVVEWWQPVPKGAPFTFKAEVAASNEFLDSDTKVLIVRLINKTKNLRSHLIAIAYAIDVHGRMMMGSATTQHASLSMMDAAFFSNPNVSGHIVHASTVVRYKTIEVSGT